MKGITWGPWGLPERNQKCFTFQRLQQLLTSSALRNTSYSNRISVSECFKYSITCLPVFGHFQYILLFIFVNIAVSAMSLYSHRTMMVSLLLRQMEKALMISLIVHISSPHTHLSLSS